MTTHGKFIGYQPKELICPLPPNRASVATPAEQRKTDEMIKTKPELKKTTLCRNFENQSVIFGELPLATVFESIGTVHQSEISDQSFVFMKTGTTDAIKLPDGDQWRFHESDVITLLSAEIIIKKTQIT